jgi:UDP-N-acetylglucosamine 1-carboxyvinyltransferase
MPGGCQIGSRKLDMHIAGLEALGVVFDITHGFIDASIPNGLVGAPVILEFPSVGATENLMMAAVRARGTTIINNAAREPEIVDLADYLIAMGALIEGAGSPTIHIEGTNELVPVASHTTVGDRIEAGTFLVAGVLGGGPVTVQGVNPAHLEMALAKLRVMGAKLALDADSVTVSHSGAIEPADIQTLPHPGFPTDLQAQFMVLDALASGRSVITENVFENRFMFADEIARMGAEIRIEGHFAFINGVEQLSGAPVRSPDLRGGAALVLAGLAADGQTVVAGTEHIDRGYEHFVAKLAALGANIERAPSA